MPSNHSAKQPNPSIPGVGVALIITRRSRVLLGRRKKEPMLNSWQLPGGWLHEGETLEQAVQRQLDALPTMACEPSEFATVTNNRFADGMHSVSLYYHLPCVYIDIDQLNARKPGHDWHWADWYDLPQPLFLPLSLLQESGYQPFVAAT